MTYLNGYTLTCPECQYEGRGGEFDPSLSDECFCPACGAMFIVELDDNDEDDEDT